MVAVGAGAVGAVVAVVVGEAAVAASVVAVFISTSFFFVHIDPRTTPLSNVSTTAHDPDMGNVSQPHIPWISGVASGVGIVLISVVVASFIIICRRKRNMCKETPNPSNPLPPHGKEATEKEPKIPTETEDPPNTHPEAVEDECMPVNGAQEDHSAPHTGTHREAVENEYVPSADTSGIGSAEVR